MLVIIINKSIVEYVKDLTKRASGHNSDDSTNFSCFEGETKRLTLWRNLSYFAGTGYLDEIPFK